MIRAYSDLHGILPIVKPCESLLIAGDISPVVGSHDPYIQINYLGGIFREYCEYLLEKVCEEIVITPGNHDFIFELLRSAWIGKFPDGVTILIDEEFTLKNGATIWGSPWVPDLVNWAFYANDVALSEKAEMIPEGIDIWLMHSPPAGAGKLERVNSGLYAGNKGVAKSIQEKKPKGFICRHIHEGYGQYRFGETEVMNVSFLDDMYDPMFRHGIIDKKEDGSLSFKLDKSEENNPRELFWSCRGEVL